MTPEEERDIKNRLLFLEKENKRLDADGKAFIKLINDHAGFINRNAATTKGLDKFIRTELQRVATSIKKVATALNRKVNKK